RELIQSNRRKGCRLSEPPARADLAEALRASLGLLDLTAARVTVPGLRAVYRAPLGGADTSLFLDGPTGAGKSEWSALCVQHFGGGMDRFHRRAPGPAPPTPRVVRSRPRLRLPGSGSHWTRRRRWGVLRSAHVSEEEPTQRRGGA